MPAALLAAVCGSGLLATTADAGTTLLSRESVIRATGDTGTAGGFDLAENSTDFDRFADQVGTDTPADGLVAIAHQYSVPNLLGESGVGLEGAFAEGQVKSANQSVNGSASSTSELELLFEVTDTLTQFEVGASLGTVGRGSVTLELTPANEGATDLPIFAVTIAPNEGGVAGMGKSVDEKGLLTPGQYLMRVEADAVGGADTQTPAEAYFTFSFQLSPSVGPVPGSEQPPAAVPLPPAVLGGGGMLAMLALSRLRRRAKLWR